MSRRGPGFAITDEWRKLVMARMAARRWNKAALARALDCSRTAVTDMLTSGPSSALVPDVERALGLEVSSQGVDPETQEIIQAMPSTGQVLRLPADRKMSDVMPVGDEIAESDSELSRIRRGRSYDVTSEWKTKVVAALRERGMSRTDLSDAVGVSRAAITDLLGKSTSSTLVRRVEEILWPELKQPAAGAGCEEPDALLDAYKAALDLVMRLSQALKERGR